VSEGHIKTAEDFRDYVLRSIFEDVELSPGVSEGKGIHIGIVDSVYTPPVWAEQEYDIYNRRSVIEEEVDRFEVEHGMEVFDILSRIVPRARFSFYQTIRRDGRAGVSNFTEAIELAIKDGVDLLNLSFGAPNQIPAKASPYYPPIEKALDSDILPIAAAGNLEYKDGPKKYVYAPANLPGVVAVGGSETLCPEDPPGDPRMTTKGPYQFNLDSEETLYCSHRGCIDETPCIRHNAVRAWPENTEPHNGKPDVLAPAHFPSKASNSSVEDVDLKRGSSYAAPIVTGAIARALCETDTETSEILDSIHDLLHESGRRVDDFPAKKLNSYNLQRRMKSSA
jgi:subtilisin family serine protease